MQSGVETSQSDSTVVRMDESNEPMDKTAHHNIADILKEVACSPVPDVDDRLIEIFNSFALSNYNRKKFTEMLMKHEAARNFSKEQIVDTVKKIEASRGYNEKKIKKLLKKIREDHGYNTSQMTKIIEKLNESDHYTALHYGTLFNNIAFCKCLIEYYKCNVNLVGWDGETPLHIAARSASINKSKQTVESSILLYLLSRPKVKIDIQDSQKRTPLHLAIMYNCVENAQYLINHAKRHAKLDVIFHIGDVQGATPLHYACRFDDTKTMILLFRDHSGLLNCETKDKKTPIDVAAEYGNLNIVKDIFERSHFIEASDQPREHGAGVSALINAAIGHRDASVLSFLVDKKVLVENYTALHFACRKIHGDKMLLPLINSKSIMYQDTQDGFSPLMVAVKHRQLKCVKVLLNHEKFTSEAFELISPSSLRTVLHICAEVNQNEIAEELINCHYMSSSFVTAADVMGNTALHICAQVGNFHMSQMLLDYMSRTISPVVPISYSSTRRTMTNLDSNGRVPPKLSATTATSTTVREAPVNEHVYEMLSMENKSKLTPIQVAIHYAKLDVIKIMLSFADPSIIINQCDNQKRTCLHMAAEKGHVAIVQLLLDCKANVDACDINDCTPLHEAARCSVHRDDNKERAQCIEILVQKGMADVNSLSIRQETPLHIACEYGSNKLIECLLRLGADLLATNVYGFNCLEVAIEEKNEEVVKFLIEHDDAFELMRNAQVTEIERSWGNLFLRHYTADTPMRKLIRQMPSMALVMLEKCSMTVGSSGTNVHKEIFLYEFLDDQFTVKGWEKGGCKARSLFEGHFGVEASQNRSKLYTYNEVDLVMNHPLFLMATCEATGLMSHRLSTHLVYKKFYNFSIYLYGIFLLLYSTFLALFTTVVLRTSHPQAYYNLTNFTQFDDALCYNVSQALMQGSSGVGGRKTSVDYILKYFLYALIWFHVVKDICIIIEISRINIMKTFTYWMEIATVVLSFIFVYDQSYQMDLTFRCPIQWQYGAFAILLSWITLLLYARFMPIIGLYVSMLTVILRKFINFLLVLIILISGFALSFYMVFQNFDVFSNAGLSYIKTALMISGEFGFDDRMYNDTIVAYYKLAYLIYILFAVVMTIIVTNLLIGLAVGEIPPLMKQASDHRNKLFFELVAESEIFRYQMARLLCCHKTTNDAIAYTHRDLNQKAWYERFTNTLLKCFMQKIEDENQSDPSTDEQLELHTVMLQGLKKQVHVLVEHTQSSHEEGNRGN